MDGWRRQAIEMFPEHRDLLADENEILSPYALWFEFLELVILAHREGDDDFLGRAYAYAEWSRTQQEKDVWNAVGVAFYEHLLDEKWMRIDAISHMSPEAIAETWTLWEDRVPESELEEFRRQVSAERLTRSRRKSPRSSST